MEITLLVILLILMLIGNSRFSAVKEAIALQNTIISQLRAELLAFQKEFRPGTTPPPMPEWPVEPVAEQAPVVEPVHSPIPEPELEPVFMESITEPEPERSLVHNRWLRPRRSPPISSVLWPRTRTWRNLLAKT